MPLELLFHSMDCVEMFDSGGEESFSSTPDITNFLRTQEKRVICNKSQLQSITSDRCGVFVLCFVYAKAVNVEYNDFLKVFSRVNLYLNDEIVDKLFKCSFLSSLGKLCFTKMKNKKH